MAFALVMAIVSLVLALFFDDGAREGDNRAAFGTVLGALLGQRVQAGRLDDFLAFAGLSVLPYGTILLAAALGLLSARTRRLATARPLHLPLLGLSAVIGLVLTGLANLISPDFVEVGFNPLVVLVLAVMPWLIVTWAAHSLVTRRVILGFAFAQLLAVVVMVGIAALDLDGLDLGDRLGVIAGMLVVGLVLSAFLVVGATVWPFFGAVTDGSATSVNFLEGAEANGWLWLLPVVTILVWLGIGWMQRDVDSWAKVRSTSAGALLTTSVLVLVIGSTGGPELFGGFIDSRAGLSGMPLRGLPALAIVAVLLWLGVYLRGAQTKAAWATSEQLSGEIRAVTSTATRAGRSLQARLQAAIEEQQTNDEAPPAETATPTDGTSLADAQPTADAQPAADAPSPADARPSVGPQPGTGEPQPSPGPPAAPPAAEQRRHDLPPPT